MCVSTGTEVVHKYVSALVCCTCMLHLYAAFIQTNVLMYLRTYIRTYVRTYICVYSHMNVLRPYVSAHLPVSTCLYLSPSACLPALSVSVCLFTSLPACLPTCLLCLPVSLKEQQAVTARIYTTCIYYAQVLSIY